MKKNKVGRPHFPKGKSKDSLVRVRLDEAERKDLAAQMKDTGKSASEIVRNRVVPQPVWVTCRFSLENLKGQKVKFSFDYPETNLHHEGIGELFVRKRDDGMLAIRIGYLALWEPEPSVCFIDLTQEFADALKEADEPNGRFKFTLLR